MKKTITSLMALLFVGQSVFSAPSSRGSPRGGGGAAAPAAGPVAARAGVRQGTVGSAPAPKATGSTGGAVAARAGVRQGTVNAAPAASAPKSSGVVSARAAATQSVIATGNAKIAGATSNAGVVSEECKEKYFGCMDSFCMVDNANGARCQCSDQVKTFDMILSEIEKLDAQSLKLATDGVDNIDMGDKLADVNKLVSDTAKGLESSSSLPEIPSGASGSGTGSSSTARKRRTIDLAAFDKIGMEAIEDQSPVIEEIEKDPLQGLMGTALHDGVRSICVQQVGAGCEKDIKMLQMMYTTQIKSDCAGYELELKKRRNASSQKLSTAQRAMKDAALEKVTEQNKYDLGQCIVEMRKCVATTGSCGDDFTKCTYFNTSEGLGGSKKPVMVPGTKIEVGEGTLITIQSKRNICETTVTKSCMSVKEQVWDAFLVDVAPALKSAEVLSENDTRQNILENISNCFQKACASKFDPKQEAADYDACLGNPEVMATTCKVVLDQAGIPISEARNSGSNNSIWKFVVAKLAAMRVDACTTAIKNALEADTACGKDLIGCASMDAEFLRAVIPPEKLVSCMKNGETITANDWTENGKIGNMVAGMFMNADTKAREICDKAAAKQIASVCAPKSESMPTGEGSGTGDLSESEAINKAGGCETAFDDDNMIGKTVKLAGTGKGEKMKLVGLIDFNNFKIVEPDQTNNDIKGASESGIQDWEKYFRHIAWTNMTGVSATESNSAANGNNGIINQIEKKISDLFEGTDGTTLRYCTQGRDLSQIMARATVGRDTNVNNRRAEKNKTEARFPKMLDGQIEKILTAGLARAQLNYQEDLTQKFKDFNDNLEKKERESSGWIDNRRSICWTK